MKFFTCLNLILFSSYAMACSCFMVPMSAKKIMESDIMIEGKIIGKKGDRFENTFTVQVNEVIKGKVSQKTIPVKSAVSGAACGVDLRMNEVYYLFIYGYKGSYNTNLCSNNQIKSSSSKRYKNIIRQFKKDKNNTVWKDEQCELIGEGKIKKKAPVGEWKFYHPDQSLESQGAYKDGKKEGEWKSYYSKNASKDMWGRLTDEQKAIVKNKENILYKIIQYKNGEIEDSKFLFR